MAPSPGFGTICCQAINEASGRATCGPKAAEIIDEQLALWMGQQPPAKAPPSSFGDRKAIPPTPEQVTRYSASIGYPMDGEAWCDVYASKGWKVGKNRMVDWQAACRTWRREDHGKNGIALKAKSTGKDYSKI